MNDLRQGRFIAFSAGSHPKGSGASLALKILATSHPDRWLSQQSWEVRPAGCAAVALRLHGLRSSGRRGVPGVAGQPMTAHWGMPILPLSTPRPVRRKAFLDTFITMSAASS